MNSTWNKISENLKLIFSIVVFFLLCNGLNLLNSSSVAGIWKLAGAVLLVLYIATLRVEEDTMKD